MDITGSSEQEKKIDSYGNTNQKSENQGQLDREQNSLTISVNSIYSQLQKIPRNEWHGRIAKLPKEQKQGLITLLNSKKSSDKDALGYRFNLRSNSQSNNHVIHMESTHDYPDAEKNPITQFHNQKEFNPHHSIRGHSPTHTKSIGQNYRYRHSQNQEILAENVGDINAMKVTKDFSTPIEHSLPILPGPDQLSQELINNRKIGPILSKALFVAGDSKDIPDETKNLIHSYLNFWIILLFQKYVSIYTYSNSKKTRKNTLQDFLRLQFPHEITRYDSNEKIIKKAKLLSKTVNSSSESILKLKFISERTKTAGQNDSCSINLVDTTGKICPPDRFDQRLELRDHRTLKMSPEYYKNFSEARSKSFTSSKKIISEWISELTIEHTPYITSSDPNFSNSGLLDVTHLSSSFSSADNVWIFILNDRLATIVELAERLACSYYDTRAPLGTIVQSLIPTAELIKKMKTESFDMPFSISHPIGLEFYILAIKLILNFIDTDIFEFDTALIFHKLCNSITQEIPSELPEHTEDDLNQGKTPITSENSDIVEKEIEDERNIRASVGTMRNLYNILGIDLPKNEIEVLGPEGLWFEVVNKFENQTRSNMAYLIPEINEYMLFISIRLKELLWKTKEDPDLTTMFQTLNIEWKQIKESDIHPDSTGRIQENLCSLSDLRNSISQLKKYLEIANKISSIYKFFESNFPEMLADDESWE